MELQVSACRKQNLLFSVKVFEDVLNHRETTSQFVSALANGKFVFVLLCVSGINEPCCLPRYGLEQVCRRISDQFELLNHLVNVNAVLLHSRAVSLHD